MNKVLVFNSALLPVSEVWIREQVVGLNTWEATLVGRTKVPDGVDLGAIPSILIDPGKGWLARKMRSLRYWCKKARYSDVCRLKAERASLIHIHFGLEAVRVWPLAQSLNIPVVITLHGYDINTYREWWEAGEAGLKNRVYPSRLLQISEQDNVHFLAVSGAIRNQSIEYGLPAEKVTVSHLGVDATKFRPMGKPLGERRDILFVGRFLEKKGCR